jgi:hypothetical protein
VLRWVFLKSRTLVSVEDEGPEPEAATTISVSITEDRRVHTSGGEREEPGGGPASSDSGVGESKG